MRHEDDRGEGEVKVSILFTESTSSLLKLELPYLEDLHRSNSTVCVISESELNYKKSIRCAADIRYRNKYKEWDSRMLSETGFFAREMLSSTTLFDDLSELSLVPCSSNASTTSLPFILQPIRLHTRPLVTVRSMAHANHLNIYSNKIFVSHVDNDGEFPSEYMCRICHGGESIDDLLTPCRCRGSVALAHLGCLERWLRESAHSYCELCQHHYQIIREPKYNVVWSIFVFLRHPGNHLGELLLDLLGFVIYTPSAIASNYMLLVLCESIARANLDLNRTLSTHVMAFTALFGIAAIDFTYSSWLFATLEKHIEAWNEWYRTNCKLKVILPRTKLKPFRLKKQLTPIDTSSTSQWDTL